MEQMWIFVKVKGCKDLFNISFEKDWKFTNMQLNEIFDK